MSARRLLAAAVATAWLLPSAAPGALALHLALVHHGGHDHGAAAHPDADRDTHREAPRDTHREAHRSAVERQQLAALLAAAEHGHAHPAGDAPHHHDAVVTGADAVTRRTLDPRPGGAESGGLAPRANAEHDGAVGGSVRLPPEPPPPSGPPLLARLSTLRI